MAIDAGSISSSVRIKLSELNADILACKTAFDNLGTEFTNQATKYSTLGGQRYVNSLKTIATEIGNVTKIAEAGGLNQQEAINRLMQLRQREMQVLQDKAVKEGTVSADTVAAINKTRDAMEILEAQSKQTAVSQELTFGQKIQNGFATLRDVMMGPIAAAKDIISVTKQVFDRFKELTDEFSQDEVASLKLSAALKASPKITEDQADAVRNLAEEFAKLTGNTISASESILTELVATGRSKEEIEKMTTAAMGLANATGINVNDALNQLNLSFSGNIGRMGRMTPELNNLTQAQLQNGGAIDVMLKKYGALSAALTQSTDVSIKNNTNAWGEWKAAIGEQNETVLRPIRDHVTDIVTAWTNAVREANNYRQVQKDTNSDNELLKAKAVAEKAVLDLDKQIRDEQLNIAEDKKRDLQLGMTEIEQQKVMKPQYDNLNNLLTKRNFLLQNVKTTQDAYEKSTESIIKTDKSSIESKNALEVIQKQLSDSLVDIDIKQKLAIQQSTEYNAMAEKQKAVLTAEAAFMKGGFSDAVQKLKKDFADVLNPDAPEFSNFSDYVAEHLAQTSEITTSHQDAARKMGQSTEDWIEKERGYVATYEKVWGTGLENISDTQEEKLAKLEKRFGTMSNAILGGFKGISSSIGTALAEGGDAWKGVGQAALNAIGAIIEGLAHEDEILAGTYLLQLLGGDFSKLGALAVSGSHILEAYGTAALVRAIPMSTGGIVLPSPGGVLTRQAENGYPELDLNGGPSGREFMGAFAQALVDKMSIQGIAASSAPVYLDGLQIAKIITRYQRNNQV